mmetsp:Transcript_29257/g.77318  ORF Transcript_29257/g.77318 Transcript_29257/m.77318 type:complete len:255 (+) Transcript_29257:222-986(+)
MHGIWSHQIAFDEEGVPQTDAAEKHAVDIDATRWHLLGGLFGRLGQLPCGEFVTLLALLDFFQGQLRLPLANNSTERDTLHVNYSHSLAQAPRDRLPGHPFVCQLHDPCTLHDPVETTVVCDSAEWVACNILDSPPHGCTIVINLISLVQPLRQVLSTHSRGGTHVTVALVRKVRKVETETIHVTLAPAVWRSAVGTVGATERGGQALAARNRTLGVWSCVRGRLQAVRQQHGDGAAMRAMPEILHHTEAMFLV